MSHFTKIKTKLYNRKIIEKSLTDLNFDWEVGGEEIRGYKNQKLSAEIIIRQNNNHVIGFKWNNNEYEIVTDIMFWEQTFSVDKFLNRIHQRYTLNLIKEVSEKQSLHLVQTENLESGSVRLLLKKF
jgi:hypothetical protein